MRTPPRTLRSSLLALSALLSACGESESGPGDPADDALSSTGDPTIPASGIPSSPGNAGGSNGSSAPPSTGPRLEPSAQGGTNSGAPTMTSQPNGGEGPGNGGDNAGGSGNDSAGGSGNDNAGGAGNDNAGGAGNDSAGGSGEGGSNDSGTPPGAIGDLTVEANPNNVLSAFVSWTTTEPSTSVVQFGMAGLTFETEDPNLVTEHRVLIIGMRADSTYDVRAISVGDSGTVQGDSTFETGSLPAQIPVAAVNTIDASKVQPGWTLMNVQKGDGTVRALSGAPPAAVIYDEEGQPVWYYIHGNLTERGGAISVDMTDIGVLIGPTDTAAPAEVDWAGNVVWTCPNTTCGSGGALSHHAGKLSNGNYIIQRDAQVGGRISQIFEELTPDNELVHSIGVEDLITPPQGASGDWAHGNAITVDLENDVAYLSFRWLGVMKAVYSEQSLLWHLPASYGAQGLGDMAFIPADSQYTDIHDPEIHDDGTILFFDNGGFTGQIAEGNPGGMQTRIVEYAIDEDSKTATLVWEFPGAFDVDPWYTQDFYVPFWGDADTLENGNILVTAGRRGVEELTPESRVFEVSKADGQVVWELMLPRDHGVYRSDRIALPLIRRIGQ